MLTNVVRGVCVLILVTFVVGVGSLALSFHREGLARVRAWQDRRAGLDPHARWIRSLGPRS